MQEVVVLFVNNNNETSDLNTKKKKHNVKGLGKCMTYNGNQILT